jgi:hypothetical protein
MNSPDTPTLVFSGDDRPVVALGSGWPATASFGRRLFGRRLNWLGLLVLGVGLAAHAPAQTLVLPLQQTQDRTPYNLQSQRGVPLSGTPNVPPGSDGRLTGSVGTSNQFQSFLVFGSLAHPLQASENAAVNVTRLVPGDNLAMRAQKTGLPVSSNFTGVVLAMPMAQVGSPLLSRITTFRFGEVIAPPTYDEKGTLLNNNFEGANVLAFDGVDDGVNIPHDPVLNAYPLTVAAWIKTTSQELTQGIISKNVSSEFNGYNLLVHEGRLRAWYFRDGTSGNSVYGAYPGLDGGPVADGQWHHVAFTVDASGGKLYVDGLLRASRPWLGTPGPTTT